MRSQGPRRRGPKTMKRKRRIFRNSKQGMEPKKLSILGARYSKTPCAMIQTSAWQRLCVYSPEVTGSCLLTSVASTMEPRKVRKLKILTGFRPVSDQFQTLCPDVSEPWRAPSKRKGKKRNTKEERKNGKKNTKKQIEFNVRSQWLQKK